MTEVSTSKLTSINMTADEVYKVRIPYGASCDISNSTSGALMVSLDEEFTSSGNADNYLTIAEGGFYNGLRINGDNIYLKSETDGIASIVRA